MRQALYLGFCLLAVACGDPLDQIPRLSGEDIADDPPQVGLVQKPDLGTGGGFLARLLRGDEGDVARATAEVAPSPEQAAAPEPVPEVNTELALADPPKPEAPKRGGLLSLLRPDPPTAAASAAQSEIAPGTVLPYGQAARICGLDTAAMGKRVQQYPEKRPVYALYDSDPRNAGPHNFYITGFADGCAQQFTASLVMFGSVGLHEQLRYGLPAKEQPYSDTDQAYEAIKSKVCRVGRQTPCGAALSRLEKDTVFITIYKNFGGNTEWSEMLLHDRQMVALSHKGG
ncbi:MAG: hypothetical protein RQ750_03295 [Roseovarius sp.]|nr:hypothetical protein [Roseovarius sp.]